MTSLETVLVCVILMSSAVHTALSRPDGAPQEACASLKPRHGGGVEQQFTPGLITLTITNTSSPNGTITTYTPGEEYTVRMSTGASVFCKGFLIVARYNSGQQLLNVVGAGFQAPSDSSAPYRLSDCHPQSSGVTHANSSKKHKLEVIWKAPSAQAGDIQFRFTCVQQSDFYYVDIPGPTITPDPAAKTDIPFVTYRPNTQPTSIEPTGSGIHVQTSCVLMSLLSAITAVILHLVH